VSLVDLALLFAGHDQGSVAALSADGEFYYCTTYLNRANQRIEAVVSVVQEGGGLSVVFHSILATATATEITNTLGRPLDSPKILASGTTFVVHWLQGTTTDESATNCALFRATMDMTAFDESVSTGWTQHGSVGVYHNYALYDVCPVVGHDDFVVARSTSTPDGEEFTVERFDVAAGYSWLDQAWTTLVLIPHAHTVLGVYAHEGDNDVLISYQTVDDGGTPNDYELWTTHLDADDGSEGAAVLTFAAYTVGFDDLGADYVQVGHERVGSNVVAIVAEARSRFAEDGTGFLPWCHHLVARAVNSSTAARTGSEHWVPNLSMCSKPWAYANGTTTAGSAPDLYVLVSYKTAYPTNDWEQSYQYVLNLDYALWNAVGSGTNLRPRPVLTVNSAGIPDGRHSGMHPTIFAPGTEVHPFASAKRVNHISAVAGAPPFGPRIKTRTVARVAWARQASYGVDEDGAPLDYQSSEIRPENAGIRLLHFHLEEPQTIFRDDSDPTQPVDNFSGAYPRVSHQAFEAGRALFISGGTPGSYDGRQVVESGFPWNPDVPLVESTATGSGGLENNANYTYMCVWEWPDNAGQFHRSGPSRIVTATTGPTHENMLLYVRAMSLSLKDNDLQYALAQSIQLTVYRLSDTTGLFHRVFGGSGGGDRPTQGPVNYLDPATQGLYFTVNDGVPDSRLRFHQVAPPELQFNDDQTALVGPAAIPVPALTCAVLWQNRIWGADALDPSVLRYSDEIAIDAGSANYRAPVFTGDQQFRIGEIGEITALQPLNNYLIVFTASGIHGIGAADAGDGLLNVTHEPLHYGTGCVSPRSVVVGPPGIFFQSAKGYHLLNRGRDLEFDIVGAQIADEIREAGNIMSASISESEPKIKLVCNGRPVTTWTTTWTVVPGLDPTGEWQITATGFDGVGQIALLESDDELTDEQIANLLAVDIQALIDDETLDGVIVSVFPDGPDVIVEWAPDVVPSYTDSSPGGTALNGVDTSELATHPRVLVFNYFTRTYSRADIVQTSTNERLSETVDGIMWRGLEGYQTHALLTQGALLIERGPNDPLAFTDQTSTGNVGIPIDVQTNWIAFATVGSWVRIYTIDIQGEKPNYSALNVDIDTDVSGDHSNPEFDTYDFASPAPANGRIRPRIQQLSSLRLRIYEDAGVTNPENVSLTAIVFDIGAHKKARRQPDAQTGT